MSSISSDVKSTARPAPDVAVDGISQRLADYLQLSRPRIAMMSAIAVAAGFVLASPEVIDWFTLLMAVAGIVCFVAVSSTWNQVLERHTDQMMNRTEERPFATGRLSALEGWLLG
ncbi:MAG: UbiA family prenyltransferase, partial [Planctomycetaceae bacterium]|nr:UbiA family prenyltransferase [Planctomycetaceae bacterium]